MRFTHKFCADNGDIHRFHRSPFERGACPVRGLTDRAPLFDVGRDLLQIGNALFNRPMLPILIIRVQRIRFNSEEALVIGVMQNLSQLLIVYQAITHRRR